MALVEKTERASQLKIKHGGFCFESKEPVEGYKPIDVFNPITQDTTRKYVRLFEKISGYGVKLEWYCREHGDQTYRGFYLVIEDEADIYQIDLEYGKQPYRKFCQFAENVDWTREVELYTFKKEKEVAFYAKQNGASIKFRYTLTDPGDCPQPVERVRLGKKTWDWEDREEWLQKRMSEVVAPAIAKAYAARGTVRRADSVLRDEEGEEPNEAWGEPATQPVSARATELLEAIWAEMKGDEEQWRDWYTDNHVAEQDEKWLEAQLAFFVQRNAAPKAPSRPPVPSPTAPRTNKTSVPSELNADKIPF